MKSLKIAMFIRGFNLISLKYINILIKYNFDSVYFKGCLLFRGSIKHRCLISVTQKMLNSLSYYTTRALFGLIRVSSILI